MDYVLKNVRGIFTPEQVEKMQTRMDEEADPAESQWEREARARRIIEEEERQKRDENIGRGVER